MEVAGDEEDFEMEVEVGAVLEEDDLVEAEQVVVGNTIHERVNTFLARGKMPRF